MVFRNKFRSRVVSFVRRYSPYCVCCFNSDLQSKKHTIWSGMNSFKFAIYCSCIHNTYLILLCHIHAIFVLFHCWLNRSGSGTWLAGYLELDILVYGWCCTGNAKWKCCLMCSVLSLEVVFSNPGVEFRDHRSKADFTFDSLWLWKH